MKPIKFRAWNDSHKKMVAVRLINFSKGTMMPYGWNMWCGEETLSEPMQFTGVKDHKGDEIYEGDILRWQGIDKHSLNTNLRYYIVVFHKGGFYGKALDKYSPQHEYLWELINDIYESEIVVKLGNIYENPELLKEAYNGANVHSI